MKSLEQRKTNNLMAQSQPNTEPPLQKTVDLPETSPSSMLEKEIREPICVECKKIIPPQQYKYDKERCWNCRHESRSKGLTGTDDFLRFHLYDPAN